MGKFNSNKIVRAFDDGETKNAMFIMMEYANGGNLQALNSSQVDEGVKWELIVDMLQAMVAMHSQGFIYRDMKPANVLVFGDCRPGMGGCHAKVTDLGLTCSHIEVEFECKGVVGTPMFMAPETLCLQDSKPWTTETYQAGVRAANDVWALGMTSYFLFFGDVPQAFAECTDLSLMLCEARQFDVSSDAKYNSTSPEVREFLHGVLNLRADDRWTASDALRVAERYAAPLPGQAPGTEIPGCTTELERYTHEEECSEEVPFDHG
mmetsp:Transcript_105220/g.296278  ORF Transcript_105220/g.296278 Transcript_105220/m.296278 type:complete len:264 (-) Transcript_105220:44-835(-)